MLLETFRRSCSRRDQSSSLRRLPCMQRGTNDHSKICTSLTVPDLQAAMHCCFVITGKVMFRESTTTTQPESPMAQMCSACLTSKENTSLTLTHYYIPQLPTTNNWAVIAQERSARHDSQTSARFGCKNVKYPGIESCKYVCVWITETKSKGWSTREKGFTHAFVHGRICSVSLCVCVRVHISVWMDARMEQWMSWWLDGQIGGCKWVGQ